MYFMTEMTEKERIEYVRKFWDDLLKDKIKEKSKTYSLYSDNNQ